MVKISLLPAFIPEETPKISSQARSPLDFAICRENYNLLIDKNKNSIRGELFLGDILLDSSLIVGARRGISISNKRLLCTIKNKSLGGLIKQLSNYYSSLKGDPYIEIKFEDENVINRYLLNQDAARILISPSLTYDHIDSPLNTNEIWVGGSVECYGRAYTGIISPNIEKFFNNNAIPFLRDL